MSSLSETRDPRLRAAFEQQLTDVVAMLNRGSHRATVGAEAQSALIETLRALPNDGDAGLVELLLAAGALELQRQDVGDEPRFDIDRDSLNELFAWWRVNRRTRRKRKPLSVPAARYLDNASRLLRVALWHLIDPEAAPEVTPDELRGLWVEFLSTVGEADPEHNRCGYLYAALSDLTGEHEPGPVAAVMTYLTARYDSKAP